MSTTASEALTVAPFARAADRPATSRRGVVAAVLGNAIEGIVKLSD